MAIGFINVGSFSGTGSAALQNPTSLQFGPDGRLYVSEQNGGINAFTVESTVDENGDVIGYAVVNGEELTLSNGGGVIQSIMNHDDDGTNKPFLSKRQVTGIVTAGTAANPVLYISSSDSRIATFEDSNLDTNSGIVTRVSWNGTEWETVDLIRGLPRSEENHATNGMVLSPDGTKLYLAVGGNTNNGAPSSFFAYTGEYALSASILEIDLVDLDSRPILSDADGGKIPNPQGGGVVIVSRDYIYDLPTLDDPNVENVTDGMGEDEFGLDESGPFGGNDGLNMAILPADAPLRIYADGLRNIYDLALTESGQLYTVDNGSNGPLGAAPIVGADGQATNLPNNGGTGDPEPLFLIEDGGYYGHPNPARSNQDLAWTVYNDPDDENDNGPVAVPDGSLDVNTVPDLSALVPDGVNIADGFLIDPSKFTGDPARLAESGVYVDRNSPETNAIATIGSSSNGIIEYRGGAFGGALDGALLVTQFNGNVTALKVNASGTGLDPIIDPGEDGILGTADDFIAQSLGPGADGEFGTADDVVLDSGDDGILSLPGINGLPNPLDVTVNPNDGTIWVAAIGGGIEVYAPGKLIVNDDLDGDGIRNAVDPFINDDTNGTSVELLPDQTLLWDFDDNNDGNLPGANGYGGGLTGVMIDGVTDIQNDFFQAPSSLPDQDINLDNVKFITAAGGGTTVVESASNGDPLEADNSGEFLFHTGLTIGSAVETFTVQWNIFNPTSTFTGPSQEIGGYLGTGDQSNYLKLVATPDDPNNPNDGEIRLLLENNDVVLVDTYIQADGIFAVPDGLQIFFRLEVDPGAGTATPTVIYETGPGTTNTVSGASISLAGTGVLDAILGNIQVEGQDTGLAVGLFSTNRGQPAAPAGSFQAVFGDIEITATGGTADLELSNVVNNTSPNAGDNVTFTLTVSNAGEDDATGVSVENLLPDGFEFVSSAGVGNYDPTTGIWTIGDVANGGIATLNITAEVVNAAPGTVLYRVNAGGEELAALDGGPNWLADQNPTPSEFLVSGNTGQSGTGAAITLDSSVDALTTPVALFQKERFDNSGGGDMGWEFAIDPGTEVEVRLYFAEIFGGINNNNQRIFDVSIEGSVPSVFDNINPLGTAGALNTGFVLSDTVVVTDGVLDIDFLRDEQNPALKGIEIIETGTVNDPNAYITTAQILTSDQSDVDSTVGNGVLGEDDDATVIVDAPAISPAPIVSIFGGPFAIGEDEGQIQLSLITSTTVPADEMVSVTFEIVPGTATVLEDYDYTPTSATFDAQTGIYTDTVTIAGSSSDATFFVDILQDLDVEGGEAFTVNITEVSPNALIGTASTSVTILDDEIANRVSISNVTDAAEPSSNGQFSVSLDTTAATDTIVSYTVNGTATAGGDYAALSGTVTILAGELAAPIDVVVSDDADVELLETVTVTLDAVTAGDANILLSTSDDTATVEIADDDSNNTIVAAINSGGPALLQDGILFSADTNFLTGGQFTDGSGADSDQPIFDGTVYETERFGGFSSGVPIKYSIPVDSGNYSVELHFAEIFKTTPGERIFDVLVEGQVVLNDLDILIETGGDINQPFVFNVNNVAPETFGIANAIDIELQASTDAAKISGIVVRSIKDVTPEVYLTVSPSAGNEAEGTVITVTATSSLAVDGDQTVDVILSGADVTAADFVEAVPTQLTILDGQTEASFTLTVADDSVVEAPKTATFAIANPTDGVILGATTTGDVVLTDDAPLVMPEINLTVTPTAGSEAAGTVITVTATASAAVSGDQTIDVALSGTDVTAADFVESIPTQLTILDGQTEASFTLIIDSDGVVEASETATFTISNPTAGAVLGTVTTGSVVIDDYIPPVDDLFGTAVEISGDRLDPTVGGTLQAGNNLVVATQEGEVGDNGLRDRDIFTFTVPDGFALTGIVLDSFVNNTPVLADGFIGIQLGNQLTVDVLTGIPDAGTDGLLGGLIYGVFDVGQNLLDTMALGGEVQPGSGFVLNPFEPALTGDVTVWLNQGAGPGTPTLNFVVEPLAVPTVDLTVTPSVGNEADGTVITVTAIASAAVTGDQTVDVTLTGAGIDAADFVEAVPTQLTILDGQTEASFTLTVADDTVIESTETATFTIANPTTGVAIGATATGDVAIIDSVVPPTGPNFGLELLNGLSAADGIATGGTYGANEVGSVVLDVLANNNNIQTSNFGANSFELTNTGDKKVAAVFIDFREAVFGDSVVDIDGSGGDLAAKPFGIDGGGADTGAFFDPNNDDVYYLPGDLPLPNTTGTGKAASGGFRGLLLKAGTVGNGFETGETVGFSGDMDPNSIAGLAKNNGSGVGVDVNAIAGWDVGGISGAEIAGSQFFVLFDDGTTASGVLGNDGSQAGSIGRAVEGQSETPVNVIVNGGSGIYGGTEPTIIVTGTPGQTVRVTLSKAFQPVANQNNGYEALVEARLADSQPEFQANNAFDIQIFDEIIGANGTVTLPAGAFDYESNQSGASFAGDNVTPIAISAVAIDGDGFAIGQVDREYLTNPTQTPVSPTSTGYFLPTADGNDFYYKIQIENPAALNGGTQPNGLWSYQTAPDSAGNQANFQGTGYYLYGSNTSSDISPADPSEVIAFEIEVPQELVGRAMRFRIRGSRDGLLAADQQNDAWINITRGDGTGSIEEFLVNTNGNEPEPISGPFIKVFGGSNNGTWSLPDNVDGAPTNFDLDVEFDSAGRYVLQVAGRSQGFHVDFIHLSTNPTPGFGGADSTFVPETTTGQPVQLINEIPDQVFDSGTTDIFDLPNGTFVDSDGDPINYQVTVTAANGSDASGVAIDATTGQLSGLSGLATDSYAVTITAADVDGAVADTFDIDIVGDLDNLVNLVANIPGASEPATDGEFTVNLATVAATDTVITYSVSGSATAGSDYTALTGEVTILAGQTSATIDISVLDDTNVELSEAVTITLDTITSGDADVVLGGATIATVTIADDDQPAGVAITVEAEDITNVSGYRIENNGNASNGSMLSLVGVAPNETGSATFNFTGATGTYDVVLGGFDESDGIASLAVSVNGSLIGTVVLDENLGGNGASPATKVERLLAGASLSTGDMITVTGNENGGEHARFDFIRFEPSGDVVTTNEVNFAVTTPASEPSTDGQFTLSLASGSYYRYGRELQRRRQCYCWCGLHSAKRYGDNSSWRDYSND